MLREVVVWLVHSSCWCLPACLPDSVLLGPLAGCFRALLPAPRSCCPPLHCCQPPLCCCCPPHTAAGRPSLPCLALQAEVNKNQRMEGSFINKSLLTLGTVIHKLRWGAVRGHSTIYWCSMQCGAGAPQDTVGVCLP